MTTLMDIEVSLRRMERSRHPHADDLFDLSTVAEELGFKPAALADILATGLGPEPRPVLYAGCYLFERWQVSSLWVWLRRTRLVTKSAVKSQGICSAMTPR
jgi:hypothetical protein